jgi:hypothetical protein
MKEVKPWGSRFWTMNCSCRGDAAADLLAATYAAALQRRLTHGALQRGNELRISTVSQARA